MENDSVLHTTPDPQTIELLLMLEGKVLALRTLVQYLAMNEIRRGPAESMSRLDTLERLALKTLKQGIEVQPNHPYGEHAIHIPMCAQTEVTTMMAGLREDLQAKKH